MPGGDADAVVPNLPSLREALTGKADAIELAAALEPPRCRMHGPPSGVL